MQKVIIFLENSFVAATYAEAGFPSIAREMASLPSPVEGWLEEHMVSAAMAEGDWASRIEREKAMTVFDAMDDLFVPLTYAEAGHPEIAQKLMGKVPSPVEREHEFMSFMETVGLRQDQVRYGLVTI